jgi:16S rRNA processing protein RimM
MIKALDQDRICVGVVVGSHGLQGSVKIKSFMVTSDDIAAYGPLTDKDG